MATRSGCVTLFEQMDLLFEKNHGILKTAHALEQGVAKHTLYAYAKKNGLEQPAHGIFVSPDAWTDAMYILHLCCGQRLGWHGYENARIIFPANQKKLHT